MTWGPRTSASHRLGDRRWLPVAQAAVRGPSFCTGTDVVPQRPRLRKQGHASFPYRQVTGSARFRTRAEHGAFYLPRLGTGHRLFWTSVLTCHRQ